MNQHFPKIPILFLTSLALGSCSHQPITAVHKEEYRNSQPLLEWIRGAEFEIGGRKIQVPVKKISAATAEQMELLNYDSNVETKFSPERRLRSAHVAGSSPSLEFAILDAFSNFILWVESQQESIESSHIVTGQSKIANFSFKVVKESKTDFSKTTISLIGPNGKSAEYSESLQISIDGSRDGQEMTEWSLSKSGDLDFKTFLSHVLGGTGSGGPRYSLEIFEDAENKSFWVLVTVRFPIEETIRGISK